LRRRLRHLNGRISAVRKEQAADEPMKEMAVESLSTRLDRAIDFDGPIIGQPMEWRLAG